MQTQETAAAPRRTLAISMLLAGLVGQLAYATMTYHADTNTPNHIVLPAVYWLRFLPWACWAVLLVQPGKRRWVVGSVAFLLTVLFVFYSETGPSQWFARPVAESTAKTASGPRRGESIVLPPLQDLDGNAFELAGYDDRPVVLSFWRSWCVPCRAEVPHLAKLDGLETAAGPIAVIGLNDEPLFIQRRVREGLGIEFRLVQHGKDIAVLQVDRFPTTVVVRDGRVLARWTGIRHDLPKHVMAALANEG